MTHLRTVIVGGGHAGGRLALELSRAGAPVTVLSAESIAPYERPPLSKDILTGACEPNSCLLATPEAFAAAGVDLRLGATVESILLQQRSVRLRGGALIDYDSLVLATGGRCRRLNVPGADLDSVVYLRDMEHAMALRAAFAACRRVVIVGGGFIGLEAAASARARGLEVTVVEASDRVLARVVSRDIADRVAEKHRSEGVVFRMSTTVEEVIGDDNERVTAVELSTGESLPCDLVVVGIGIEAETSLAAAAGLAVREGVVVDALLRTSDPSVYAIGDVTSFWHPLFRASLHLESWRNAEDHAAQLASTLLGGEPRTPAVPWFWSNQYNLSLQLAGLPHFGASVVERELADGAAVFFHLDAFGRLVGATGLGPGAAIGKEIRWAQMLIELSAFPEHGDLADPACSLKALVAIARAGGLEAQLFRDRALLL